MNEIICIEIPMMDAKQTIKLQIAFADKVFNQFIQRNSAIRYEDQFPMLEYR